MPCYTINQGLTAFFNEINMLMNANFSGHMRMTLKNILAVVMAGVVVVALGGCGVRNSWWPTSSLSEGSISTRRKPTAKSTTN